MKIFDGMWQGNGVVLNGLIGSALVAMIVALTEVCLRISSKNEKKE